MFGHLPLVIKECIIKNFGVHKWEEVRKKCDLKEEIIERGTYEVSLFDKLMKSTPKVCGIDEEKFQKLLGEAYLTFTQTNGSHQLLRLLGRTFVEFLENLDFVHTLALGSFPNANIPLFRVEYDSENINFIKLHYYSHRDDLFKMVQFLLEAIGRTFFKKKIITQIIEQNKQEERFHVVYSLKIQDLSERAQDIPTFIAQTKRNAEFQISERDVMEQKMKIEYIRREFGEDALPVVQARMERNYWKMIPTTNFSDIRFLPTIPSSLALNPEDFCELFPFHIMFDQSMMLKQAGVQIQAIIPDFRTPKVYITKYLELIHPKTDSFTYENVSNFICCTHIVKTLVNKMSSPNKKDNDFYFRGQMAHVSDNQYILFLCSPMISCLKDVDNVDMRMSELPNHDATKYFCSFHIMRQQGDWKDGFLGEIDDSSEDNAENGNPSGIASIPSMMAGVMKDMIRSGRKYKNCSILFCDIVQFSSLVTACDPKDVLEMLNNLYDEFDKLAQIHDVFKIDVVGDAYLVLSGIPEQAKFRAERIANMALAMIMTSKLIKSPFDYGHEYGKRALIRIGVHCGEIIGGIIGSTYPKFTVMGENVVLASKLESHGVPDKIHISAAFYKEVASSSFDIVERGCIDVRGKGRQFTYFLNRNIDVPDNVLLGKTRSILYGKR